MSPCSGGTCTRCAISHVHALHGCALHAESSRLRTRHNSQLLLATCSVSLAPTQFLTEVYVSSVVRRRLREVCVASMLRTTRPSHTTLGNTGNSPLAQSSLAVLAGHVTTIPYILGSNTPRAATLRALFSPSSKRAHRPVLGGLASGRCNCSTSLPVTRVQGQLLGPGSLYLFCPFPLPFPPCSPVHMDGWVLACMHTRR